mgnify:CR=1 FL=1
MDPSPNLRINQCTQQVGGLDLDFLDVDPTDGDSPDGEDPIGDLGQDAGA